MSNSMVVFNFESNDVRTMTDESGTPWFNANDICAVLGMANPSQAIKSHVDEDDLQKLEVTDNLGRKQLTNHVNESGLYSLIVGSNKPEAKKFKRWVTSDVLPSIRKTGSYSTNPNPIPALTISMPQLLKDSFSAGLEIAKLCGFTDNQALLSADRCSREFTGRSALAAIGATHLLADARGRTYTPTDLGKMIDPPQSARKLNVTLEESGLQSKDVRGDWIPTSIAEGLFEWLDTGKRHSDGTPVKQLRWFQTVLGKVKAA